MGTSGLDLLFVLSQIIGIKVVELLILGKYKIIVCYECRGYLGPGGVQDNGQFRDCVGGATGYLDRLILGEKHIYQHPTARKVYGSGPFDPEGLVGKSLWSG
jgi:hypothetical protein